MYLKVTVVKPINTLREESPHDVGSDSKRKGDSFLPSTQLYSWRKRYME